MPKLTKASYTPGDRKWWGDVAKLGDDERVERERAINAAWAYYYGDQPEPLRKRPEDPNYNVILDLAGQALDSMVAFMGKPELEVVGGTGREPNAAGLLETVRSPEQEALDDLWEANDLDLLITDLLLAGSIAGHTFVKQIPDGETVRVELIDPRYMTVYWLDHRAALFYRMKWTVDENETRTQDIVPNRLLRAPVENADEIALEQPDGWTIIEYVERANASPQEVGRDAWAFPFPPIVDWKNAPKPFSYYGRSDLTPVRMRTNDAANLAASNIQKIIFHHGGPQTIVTGGSLPDEIETGPGTVLEIDDAEAKVYNLEMLSDLAASMGNLTMLRGAFFESVRVVDRASIKDKLGDLTNFAVRMLYGAQNDAAAQKRMLYGRGLALASERALAVLGRAVGKVVDKWDDTLPQDRGELVTSVVQEADLGFVSQQTLLEALGHDPVVEAEQRAEEVDREQGSAAEFLAGLGQRGGAGFGRLGGGNGQPRRLGAGRG